MIEMLRIRLRSVTVLNIVPVLGGYGSIRLRRPSGLRISGCRSDVKARSTLRCIVPVVRSLTLLSFRSERNE